MRVIIGPKRLLRTWLGVAIAFAALGWMLAVAEVASAEPAARPRHGYFIEFRARFSDYLGHTYVVYGRTNAAGRMLDRHTIGVEPGDDYLIAIFIPVIGIVRPEAGDHLNKPLAVYRRYLTAAEYRRVLAKIQELKSKKFDWHLLFNNCTDFAIQIADVIPLNRYPGFVIPKLWVEGLQMLNGD